MAEKSGKLLVQIVPGIQKTAKLVQEITASSIEQNTGADQVNNAVQQLSQVIQQNATASEEMAASSEELANQAGQLQEAIAFFKLDSRRRTPAGAAAGKRKLSARRAVPETFPGTQPAGVALHLGGDALDAEYEQY